MEKRKRDEQRKRMKRNQGDENGGGAGEAKYTSDTKIRAREREREKKWPYFFGATELLFFEREIHSPGLWYCSNVINSHLFSLSLSTKEKKALIF